LEVTRRVWTFAVPVTFAEVAKMFVVVTAFEAYTFPRTLRVFPKALVPIPKFEVTLRVWTFAVPETFAKVAKMFVVVIEFEAYTLPATLRAFPNAPVPIPKLAEVKRSVWTFAVPETFAEVAKIFVVVTVFDT
jgi:hypothetical protein